MRRCVPARARCELCPASGGHCPATASWGAGGPPTPHLQRPRCLWGAHHPPHSACVGEGERLRAPGVTEQFVHAELDPLPARALALLAWPSGWEERKWRNGPPLPTQAPWAHTGSRVVKRQVRGGSSLHACALKTRRTRGNRPLRFNLPSVPHKTQLPVPGRRTCPLLRDDVFGGGGTGD